MADDIGYPVVLKAAGGGGGRRIRIVGEESELEGSYATASREASGAFDDARVYVERFISPARHVEVQVLGDGSSAVHLGERECSLQRRRQQGANARAARLGDRSAAVKADLTPPPGVTWTRRRSCSISSRLPVPRPWRVAFSAPAAVAKRIASTMSWPRAMATAAAAVIE